MNDHDRKELEVEIDMADFIPGRLSNSLRVLMKQQGCESEREFARRNGFPQPTVNQWFTESTPPNLKNLEKIAKLFGMNLTDYLKYLRGEEDTEPQPPTLDEIEEIASRLSPEERRELIKRLVDDL